MKKLQIEKKNRLTLDQNKKIQESMKFISTDTNNFTAKLSILWMMVFSILAGIQDISAQCERRAMACNNLVTIPLNENCEAVVTIDMILEDQQGDDSEYELRIFDPEGNRIASNTLTEDYDCQHLKVEVECNSSEIYCWGYIVVEDKIKPDLTISPLDTAISCFIYDFNLDPNALVTEVTFSDQGTCEKPDSLGIVDITFASDEVCSDTVEIIKRYWKVVDKSKYQNDTTVIQTIYLLRANFSDFIYPRDTVIDCADAADLDISSLGEPMLRSCDPYFDIIPNEIEFDGLCGAMRKITREWKILDPCRRLDTTVYQNIEIVDNTAADIDFSEFDIPTDRYVPSKEECIASATDIPNPIITDCSVITPEQLRAWYQFVDDAGMPFGLRFDAFVNDMETFDLIDVPIGQAFKVIFEVTDSCGNISSGTSGSYTIEDTVDPNAICEKNTIVGLTSSGFTEVTAESLDDHSFDNCGVVKREIRRMDSSCSGYSSDRSLGSSVHFCCDDVANNPIRVLLRVYDASDNYSDCIINVIVQDKRLPVINCPSSLTFNCDVDVDNLESLIRARGLPSVSWVCGAGPIEVSIPDFSISTCGNGSFSVTWTATDANGSSATCTQNITIDNLDTPDITPPTRSEYSLTNCTNGTDPESIPGSKPTVTDVDCENIAITYEDLIFIPEEGPDEPCIKIQRIWTILDWCRFENGNLNSAILASFEQVIKVYDSQAPSFSEQIEDFEVIDNDYDCFEEVSITVNAIDDCSDIEEIIYSYTIDLNGDEIPDVIGNGNTMERVFPVGDYTVTFSASDRCGNTGTTDISFEIKSNKAPIPILLGKYTVNLQSSGTTSLLASDLNIKSTQGCSSSELGLRYAFSPNPSQTVMSFDCDDLDDGRTGVQDVDVYVIDERGNSEFASVEVTISDLNFNACPDVTSMVVLQGSVVDEKLNGVANISVSAFNPSTNEYESTLTDGNGEYVLEGLPSHNDYMVTPALEGFDLSGVSTLDLVLIQRHILGLLPLSSPYKIIAADVNNSKSISASDLAELRKLILGTKSSLGTDNSWKFITKDYQFDNMLSPWDYPVMAEVYNVVDNINALDFIGLKVGDVNDNAFGALAQDLAGPRSSVNMTYNYEQSGNTITYTLTPQFTEDVLGMQLALDYDSDMAEFVEIQGFDISSDHVAIYPGQLKLSWSTKSEKFVDASEVIKISMKLKGAQIPTLRLNEEALSAEVYSANLETSRLVLSKSADSFNEFQVMQNTPNPFLGTSSIEFYLPESGDVRFSVTDINGRLVMLQNAFYSKGLNRINLDSEDLNGSGIFYYTLTTTNNKETKRMIVLH